MSRRLVLGSILIALALASPAGAAVKGGSMFSIGLSNGTADLIGPESGSGSVSSYAQSEWGAQGEYWHMMSDDYAFTLAGGVSWFSEKDEVGDNASPLDEDFKYSQSSWHARVGGDRVVSIGERAMIYFGPGLEYWSGKSKFEFETSGSVESEPTKRISLSGRIGGIMTIGSNWGMTGHVGHVIGHASAEDAGAKATWWPSSFDAAGGLIFMFGGTQ